MKWLNFLLASLLSISSVLAQYEVTEAAGFAAGMIFVMVLMFVLMILATAFWIWMLVDCAQRDVDSKVAWILLIALTGLIGALIYYFIVKRKA